MAPLGALSQAWVSTKASLPLAEAGTNGAGDLVEEALVAL